VCVCEGVWLAEREETQEDEEKKKLEQAADAAEAAEVAEKMATSLSALKKQAASRTHALLTHHALLLINLYSTHFCARLAEQAQQVLSLQTANDAPAAGAADCLCLPAPTRTAVDYY